MANFSEIVNKNGGKVNDTSNFNNIIVKNQPKSDLDHVTEVVHQNPSGPVKPVPTRQGGGLPSISNNNNPIQNAINPGSGASNPLPQPTSNVNNITEVIKNGQPDQPKLAAYIKEAGGVATSDGGFFYDRTPDFVPKGYERAYADIIDDKVYLVPEDKVGRTMSTYEGPAIVKPVPQVKSAEDQAIDIQKETVDKLKGDFVRKYPNGLNANNFKSYENDLDKINQEVKVLDALSGKRPSNVITSSTNGSIDKELTARADKAANPGFVTRAITRVKETFIDNEYPNNLIDLSKPIVSTASATPNSINEIIDVRLDEMRPNVNYGSTYGTSAGQSSGGRGTQIVTTTPGTFAQALGIPDDSAAKTLQTKFVDISDRLNRGIINDKQAQNEWSAASDRYNKVEIVKSVPKQLAIVIGLTALDAVVPGAALAGGSVFTAQLALQRKQIAEQFAKYPKESAYQAGALITGGLIGAMGSAKAPKIDVETFEKPLDIIGAERNKAIAIAKESLTENVKTLLTKNQISASNVFKALTKDGREITVVVFSKLKPGQDKGSVSGNEIIVGFEKIPPNVIKLDGREKIANPTIGDRFIGKAYTVVNEDGSKSYIRGYRYKIANNAITNYLERVGLTNKPEQFEILEKSKQLSRKAGGNNFEYRFESETRSKILSQNIVGRQMAKLIRSIQNKVDSGLKLSNTEIRALINLERRSYGQKPFSESEWKQTNIGILTKDQVFQILNRTKKNPVVIKLSEEVANRVRTRSLSVEKNVANYGQARVETLVEKPKIKGSLSNLKRSTVKVSEQPKKSFTKKINYPKIDVKTTSEGMTLTQLKENIRAENRRVNKQIMRNVGTKGYGVLLAFNKKVSSAPKQIRETVLKTLNKLPLRVKTKIQATVQHTQPSVRQSEYAGRGQYERTEFTSVSNPKFNTKSGTNALIKSSSSQIEVKVQSSITSENTLTTPQTRISQKERQNSRFNQMSKTVQSQAFEQKQQSNQNNKFRNKITARAKFRAEPARMTVKPNQLNADGDKTKKNTEFKRNVKTGFDTYIKEKGKFVRINEKPFANAKQAKGFGFAEAKSNLDRSVLAVKTNRAEPINSTGAQASFNKLSSEFRPSKRFGPAVSVQKNALSTKKEVSLIQAAKAGKQPFKKGGAPKIMSIK